MLRAISTSQAASRRVREVVRRCSFATIAAWRCSSNSTYPFARNLTHNQHMRFARLQCDVEGAPLGIEDLVESAELDYLQLDYPRPRWTNVEGAVAADLPEYAVGFGETLRSIVKPLYLGTQLHVVASAGWADAFSCVEKAAAVLLETGCGNMPLAAVRGSNLLPILEMLERDGVRLDNAETGARWRELKAPVLAADLQLGAGPLALALAEQARVIVAGAFDGMAPLAAAGAHRFGWKWEN